MKAFLTFVRKNTNDIHLIGIENPNNINILEKIDLISGQPVICIIENNKINGFYLINESGELIQCYGIKDFLFDINIIFDLTLINLIKFNTIKHFLISIFSSLSLNEIPELKNELNILENKVFYNLLHAEIETVKIKSYILKEIKKSNLNIDLKNRFINKLNNTNSLAKKNIKKKINLNLFGYGIYISSNMK